MKRLYSLMLSAVVAVAASAAVPQAATKVVSPLIGGLKFTAKMEARTEMTSEFIGVPGAAKSHVAAKRLAVKPTLKRVAKAPRKAEGEEGSKYDGYYTMTVGDWYFNSSANAEVPTTVFVMVEDGEIGIVEENQTFFPDMVIGTFNEETGVASFEPMTLVEEDAEVIIFSPFEYDWNLEDIVLKDKLEMTYDEATETFTAPADHGFSWPCWEGETAQADAEAMDLSAETFGGWYGLFDVVNMVKQSEGEEPGEDPEPGEEGNYTIEEHLINNAWEASYVGMLESISGTHSGEAVFTLSGEQLFLKLPDYSQQLLVGFNESDASLIIYGTVNYGKNSQDIDIKLQPITTSGAPSPNNVIIPYNAETKAYEFPATFAWAMLAYNGNTMAGYFWAATKFTLNIPKGDYGLKVSFADGEVSADNKWTINVEKGADVAEVKYFVFPYDEDAADYVSYFATLGTTLKGNSLEVDPVNANFFDKPMTESAFASVVFAAFDADNNIVKTANLALPVIIDDDQEGWATVGSVEYVDGIFSLVYPSYSYSKADVEVQAKTDNSPVYRFVAPYADDPRFDLAGHTHSMVVDATHSDWVAIPLTFSGVDAGGDGTLAFGTFAALGYDYEEAMQKGFKGGIFTDNVVTFPAQTILCHEQFYNQPGSWSYVNSKVPVEITLPAISIDVTVKDENGDLVEGATVEIASDSADEPAAQADVTTDAEGKATIDVPFSTGYFGKVNLKVNTKVTEVALNGAKNVAEVVINNSSSMIKEISSVAADKVIYDVQGRRVANPTKGLYIINGKKALVK